MSDPPPPPPYSPREDDKETTDDNNNNATKNIAEKDDENGKVANALSTATNFFSSISSWGSTATPPTTAVKVESNETAKTTDDVNNNDNMNNNNNNNAAATTNSNQNQKVPMEQMLRQIAKQEADRRMAKFRIEMNEVKQERDRYKDQLKLMEEEFVKERKDKVDLQEKIGRLSSPSNNNSNVSQALLQSQAAHHEEILSETLKASEQKDIEIERLKKLVNKLEMELKESKEEFDLLLLNNNNNKDDDNNNNNNNNNNSNDEDNNNNNNSNDEDNSKEKIINKMNNEKSEEMKVLQLEIENLKTKVKAQESKSTTSTTRHEEILSEALQAAGQQSDRADDLQSKLNVAMEEIKKLKDESTKHVDTINKIQNETMSLIENAVNAEKQTQETLRQQLFEEKKTEWEKEKSNEFETSLLFWQKRWASDKKLAVENAIAKTLDDAKQRFHSEKNAAIELAKMDVENSLRNEHSSTLQKHHEESLAKHMASQASITAAEAKCEQLEDKVEELEQTIKNFKRNKEELTKFHDDEIKALRTQKGLEVDRITNEFLQKERRWETLDRAKDIEFEEEIKRLRLTTATKHQQELEEKLENLRLEIKKSYEEPEDEKWASIDLSLHPTPPMNLRSPVVLHILDHWTDDPKRLKFMQKWLDHIVSGQSVETNNKKFRQGLELAHLKPEVCDGFEKIILPLLQKRGDIAIKAMRRTQRETWNDLRVKVMPKAQYMQEEIKNLRQKQINNYASPSSIYRSPAPSVDNNNTSMRNRGRSFAPPPPPSTTTPNSNNSRIRRSSFSGQNKPKNPAISAMYRPPSKKAPKPPPK